MASTCVALSAGNLQAARFAGKAPSSPAAGRPAVGRFVVRAEDNKLATVQKTDAVGLYQNFTSDQSLSYLDGAAPGFRGFDPLALSDPEGAGGFVTPEWLRYSEVIHSRWAMLGAAGCIAPEILASAGVIPQAASDVTWFKTGVIPPAGQYGNYWIDPYSLFFIEVVAVQFAELRRWQDYRNPGSMGKQYFLGLERVLGGSGNPSYPGGQFFNLFNLGSKSDDSLKDLKNRELENGRLAMLAMFGYGAQAVMTRVGPFQNLIDHISDPTHNNILANFGKIYGQ